MIDEVDFHCDIVARVPFEISEMILHYLPLYQVFKAQRVSRRWRELLSSPNIVKTLLRSWYPGSETPGVSDGLSARKAAWLNAEHVDAYKGGKAFSMKTWTFEPYTDGLDCELVAYADGVVAWTDATNSCVCRSLDLKTGNTQSFMTEDRSSISHLVLSSTMIAAMSMSGKCYIWTFREQESISIRMPSARVIKVLLSDNSLVVVFDPHYSGDGAQVEMITWTLYSQRTHSFSLNLRGNHPNSLETKVLLDKKGASVILLERPLGGGIGEYECIYFTRASLTGIIRAQGVGEGPRRESHEDYARRTIPSQTNQYATIWAFVRNLGRNERAVEFVRVRYDFDWDRVVFDTRFIKGFERSHAMSDMFFFKDAAYYRHYFSRNARLRVIDFNRSICSRAPMSTLISWSESWPQGGLNNSDCMKDDYDSLLFGDENFLVNILNGGILAWSFDRNIKMVNENTAYRVARGGEMAISREGTPLASTTNCML